MSWFKSEISFQRKISLSLKYLLRKGKGFDDSESILDDLFTYTVLWRQSLEDSENMHICFFWRHLAFVLSDILTTKNCYSNVLAAEGASIWLFLKIFSYFLWKFNIFLFVFKTISPIQIRVLTQSRYRIDVTWMHVEFPTNHSLFSHYPHNFLVIIAHLSYK